MIEKYVRAIPRILYNFQEIQEYLAQKRIPNNRKQAGRWLIDNGWIKTTKKINRVNVVLYYKEDENGNNIKLDFKE